MDLFLRILGVIALVVVFGLVVIAAFMWWFFRRIKRSLGAGTPPLTIELVADSEPGWIGQAPFNAVDREFRAMGFTQVGPFAIEGIAGVRVLGFSHPSSGAFGCCYNHPAAGCFIDLCATLEDGLEITVTNAPAGGEMETRPGTEKLFLAGSPLSALHEALQTKIANRAVRLCSPESFQKEFVAAYARDMAWRANKLGVSEAEFRRVAANGKQQYTEDQLTAAFHETKLQELRQWTLEAAEEFARTSSMSVARWKEFEDALVIFRDDFHPEAYLDYVAELVDLPNETKVKLLTELNAGVSLEDLLKRVSASAGCRFVQLGAIERPLRCTIYGIEHPNIEPENQQPKTPSPDN